MEFDKIAQNLPIESVPPQAPGVFKTAGRTRFEMPCATSAANLLYVARIHRPDWRVNKHYHNHFEVCLVVKGECRFLLHDCIYTAPATSLFLVKPGEPHCGAASGQGPFVMYYIGFRPGLHHTLDAGFYNIQDRRVIGGAHDSFVALFQTIMREIEMKQIAFVPLVQSLFTTMLVSILRTYHAHQPLIKERRGTLKPVTETTLQFIHLHPDWSLDAIAKAVHVHKAHLARVFKQQLGVTIGTYRRNLRLDKAKQLLVENKLPISLIATQLGFASVQSFSSSFREMTGMAPHEYRNTID